MKATIRWRQAMPLISTRKKARAEVRMVGLRQGHASDSEHAGRQHRRKMK